MWQLTFGSGYTNNLLGILHCSLTILNRVDGTSMPVALLKRHCHHGNFVTGKMDLDWVVSWTANSGNDGLDLSASSANQSVKRQGVLLALSTKKSGHVFVS